MKNFFEHIASQYPYLVIILTAALALILMPFVIKIAKKYHFVAVPNKRSSHSIEVTNIGGLNVFLSSLIIILPLLILGKISITFCCGYLLIFLIGFIDDRLSLSFYWKLLGETLAALLLIFFAEYRIESFYGVLGIETLPIWISYILSYIVFLVIINAVNLIDGVDGLSSGLGILYCTFFGFWFYFAGFSDVALLCFAIVGTLLVFFIFNVFGKNGRKVFLGDSGSLLIGYFIAFLFFSFVRDNYSLDVGNILYFRYALVSAFAIIFIPVFDVVRVSLTRIKHKKSPFRADKNHIHHLLLCLNLSHKNVSLILVSASTFFIVIALLLKKYNYWVQILFILLTGIMLTLLLWRFIDRNRKEE